MLCLLYGLWFTDDFLRNMVFYGHECSHEIRCGADLFQRSHNGITDEVQRHDRRGTTA